MTPNTGMVCALKSLLWNSPYCVRSQVQVLSWLDSSYPDERMAGSMAVFGVRSRFEVQHWHVNGALATLLGFALTHSWKWKWCERSADHDSTKALLTRWTLSIIQGLICDLAPLFTFDDPRRNKRTPYPGDRAGMDSKFTVVRCIGKVADLMMNRMTRLLNFVRYL
jgi:hypothetical protein